MKTAILCILLAGATVVRADLTVNYLIESAAVPAMNVVLQCADGKARVDSGKDSSALFDAAGDVTTLVHAQKVAMKLPKGMLDAAKAAAAQAASTAEPKKTGKSETIGGFRCEEYIMESGDGHTVSVWVSKDIPDYKELVEQMAAFGKQANPAGAFNPLHLDGFPIRTKIVSGPGAGTTVTVVGLGREPVPAGVFEVPAGYQVIEMPGR